MSPKSFRLLPGLVAGLCLVLAAPAFAQKVYQWKDAQGVTHYSDSPPPDQVIKGRAMPNKDGQATQAPVAKPVVNANCSNARSNLAVLQGTGAVGVDEDKDGKPDRNLTDSERGNRTELAQAQIKTYCGDATVASGG